jgi:hypothetical protein
MAPPVPDQQRRSWAPATADEMRKMATQSLLHELTQKQQQTYEVRPPPRGRPEGAAFAAACRRSACRHQRLPLPCPCKDAVAQRELAHEMLALPLPAHAPPLRGAATRSLM